MSNVIQSGSCPCLLDVLEEQEPVEEHQVRENARGTFRLCCPVVVAGRVRRTKGYWGTGRVTAMAWMKLTRLRWEMR